MNGAAVFFLALSTSAATSVGTVYAIHELALFESEPPKRETVIVPDFKGLGEAQAVSIAGSLDLLVSVDGHEESSAEKAGVVLRQALAAGQTVLRGERVGITLAKEMPRVPAVAKMSVADATRALTEAGYRVEQQPVNDDVVEKGLVASQLPDAGVALAREQTVVLRVSQGAALVEVPRVISSAAGKATKSLEELGLVAKIRWVNLAETWSGVVLSQTPEPGEKVEKGSSVEIVINR